MDFWLGEDEPTCHAPSEYVAGRVLAREERRLRERAELQEMWREEVRTRRQENARRTIRKPSRGGDR
jgi:hypothetical protein